LVRKNKMTPKIFGLVNPSGVIENAFYWNQDPAEYPVDAGYSIVRIDNVENCGIGWTYINGEFAEPIPLEAQPQPQIGGAETL
jgi:hypothetical protein